jgi:signal transduction histidine kinase
LSIGTDITERKQAEKALRRAKESAEVARSEAEVAKRHEEQRREEADRRRRVAESLRAVVAILNSQQALDDVLDYIVEQAASVLGSQAAAIYRVPATPAGVVLLSTHGISEPPLMEAYLPARSAAMRRMLKERGAIALSDTTRVRAMRLGAGDQTKASAAPFVVPLDSSFRAVLAGPIVVGGESYGGLALLFQKPRSFTADECELASMLCDQVALAIENANLRDKAMQASVLAERARIARELHDAVTQTLFTASLVASALPNIWGRDPDAGRQGVENLRSLTRTALAEMRTLLVELRPAALSEKPLGDLLQQLSEAMSARVQAPIAIEVAPDAAEELPAHVQVAFYRIAQEALNNISKYARARHVLIQLRTIGGRLVMRVRDDGVGFVVARSSNGDSQARIQTRAQQGEGHAHAGGITVESAGPVAVNGAGVSGSGHSGITIMRERARSIGASFALRTRPGCGTLLVARWPGSEGSKDNATADGSYELSKTK